MDSTRWEKIQALFHEAADRPRSEQQDFLSAVCGDDPEVMSKVLAMLEEDARDSSLLDRDVAHVAHQMLADPAPAEIPFRGIGPYRTLRLLGEGGMGVVYLAERSDLGHQVAIKLLRDAWLSPARRDRFASEQRTLAQLNHPSIARLYDADLLADGTPWFAMEYVEGWPLTTYSSQHHCSIRNRLLLLRSVCEAVQYAHQRAVIHRDLKPSNILVKSDGSIRLLDFGIAKQMDSLGVPADQTMTGLRLMTPAYAAPEQIRGEPPGVQTDVYSLGVILYDLLAGKLPFDLSNRTPGEAETLIVESDPERPSTVARRVSGQLEGPRVPPLGKTSWADLDVLCLTAMHKDPQKRYQSVEALIRDIDHYLKGEPLEARPDTIRYRLGKFVRRNQRPVAAAAAVVIVVISLIVFYTVRLSLARNEALAEAARTQRIQRFMLNLFEGGDKEAGPADDLRVTTLVDRGAQEARALEADPAVQAELYLTLGSIYQKLGKFEQANSLLGSALERRKSLFGSDRAEVAEGLAALGMLRNAQAQYDEAERLVRESLEMSRKTLPPNHPMIAKATAFLGQVLENRGEYPEAIKVLEEAVRLQSAPGVAPADLAASLTELANSHFYAGHYDISESLNRRVLEMDRQIYGERHPHVADDLINLGAIQFEKGRFSEAENYYRPALDIIRSFYGKEHQETASALTMLGRALLPQAKLTEASDLLREALRIQERVYGDVHPRVASALNELGKISMQQGRLDEAETELSRAANIYRATYNDKHYYIGVALSNLAGVWVERKEYARAEQTFRDVLRRYDETLAADHQLVGIARIRLGRVLLLQRRYAEAEQESLVGYNILRKQTSPPASWFQMAMKDLVAEYEALNQPDKAGSYRAQLNGSTGGSTNTTASKQ